MTLDQLTGKIKILMGRKKILWGNIVCAYTASLQSPVLSTMMPELLSIFWLAIFLMLSDFSNDTFRFFQPFQNPNSPYPFFKGKYNRHKTIRSVQPINALAHLSANISQP
jgi:hypothetical protein